MVGLGRALFPALSIHARARLTSVFLPQASRPWGAKGHERQQEGQRMKKSDVQS